jgi:hypothetical protein
MGWPKALGPDGDETVLLPQARLLIIDETAEGVFLLRYSAQAQFAGDTWHETVAYAKEQAAFEFGSTPGWTPLTTSDPTTEELVRHLLITGGGALPN